MGESPYPFGNSTSSLKGLAFWKTGNAIFCAWQHPKRSRSPYRALYRRATFFRIYLNRREDPRFRYASPRDESQIGRVNF